MVLSNIMDQLQTSGPISHNQNDCVTGDDSFRTNEERRPQKLPQVTETCVSYNIIRISIQW